MKINVNVWIQLYTFLAKIENIFMFQLFNLYILICSIFTSLVVIKIIQQNGEPSEYIQQSDQDMRKVWALC